MASRVHRWSIVMASAAFVAAALAGCQTIGEDLADIGRAILPPDPSDAARMAIDPDDPDRRREGTLLLSGASFGGEPAYVAMYREYVQYDDNALVRAVAARALGRHGAAEDAELLAARLEDDNEAVRWEAAKALQRLHNPATVRPLLRVLRDPDENSDVRVAAATALGQYPEDRVFQGLVIALDATELSVNLAAAESLRTLTGVDNGLDPPAWLAWYGTARTRAFDEARPFEYPVYERRLSWLEKLIFWSPTTFEEPGTPRRLGDPSVAPPDAVDEAQG